MRLRGSLPDSGEAAHSPLPSGSGWGDLALPEAGLTVVTVTRLEGMEDAPEPPSSGIQALPQEKPRTARRALSTFIQQTLTEPLLCTRTGASRGPSSWREVSVWDENILSSSQSPVRESRPSQVVQKRELKYRELAAKSIEKTENTKTGDGK